MRSWCEGQRGELIISLGVSYYAKIVMQLLQAKPGLTVYKREAWPVCCVFPESCREESQPLGRLLQAMKRELGKTIAHVGTERFLPLTRYWQ